MATSAQMWPHCAQRQPCSRSVGGREGVWGLGSGEGGVWGLGSGEGGGVGAW